MRVVNFSSARNNFNRVLDQAVEDYDYTIITRRDKADAVVMSLELFNSYMETLHLLQSPKNAAHLMKGIAEYRAGKAEQKDLVDE